VTNKYITFISSGISTLLAKILQYSSAQKLPFFVATQHAVHPIRNVANNNTLFTVGC